MTLPVGVTTCLVTFGKSVSYLGTEGTMTARLVADRDVVHAATGTRVASGNDLITTESGILSFAVPHTDQSGMIDAASGGATTGWLYTLIATVTVAQTTFEVRKNFQPVVGQDTLDLDILADGTVTPGVTLDVTTVTSVDGATGAVDLSATYARVVDGVLMVGDEVVETGGGSAVDQKIVVNPSGDTTGATDQTNVATALTALLAGDTPGGTLELGAGDFYWSSQQIDLWTTPARLKIVGQGQATRIHSTATGTAGTAKAIFYVYGGGDEGDYPTQVDQGATGANWLEISDLDLVGNSHACGLALWGIYQGRVSNINAQGFTAASKFGSALYMNFTIDVVVENLITYQCNYGAYLEGWSNVNNFIGGWFMASTVAGCSIQGIYATGNNFWGTVFQTSGVRGLEIGPGVSGTHLYGCWIENNARGVFIEGDDTVIDSPIISSNGRDFEIKATANNTVVRSPHNAGLFSAIVEAGATAVVFADPPADVTYADVIDGTLGREVTFRRNSRTVEAEDSSGAAYTVLNTAAADLTTLNLTADCELTFPVPKAGMEFDLTLIQDGTGSREVTWPINTRWPDDTAPVLSTAPGARDRFRFISDDGDHWYGHQLGLAYVGTVTFDPSSVANLRMWFDASQLVGLADGAAVSSWTDESGNSRPVLQATAGSRPTYYSSTTAKLVNGKPAVWFDGGDSMRTDLAGFSLAHPATIYAVVKRETTGDMFVHDGGSGGARMALFVDSNKWADYSGSQITSVATVGTGTYKLTSQFAGGSSLLRRNGTQIATGNTGANAPDNFTLGANHGGIAGWNGAICEVLAYAGAHDLAQIEEIEAYLTEKWG